MMPGFYASSMKSRLDRCSGHWRLEIDGLLYVYTGLPGDLLVSLKQKP
jgi:hypothetical protein